MVFQTGGVSLTLFPLPSRYILVYSFEVQWSHETQFRLMKYGWN